MTFRNKMMLACMALLVFVMGTIFLRVGVAQIFVKKLHMDNAVTRAVLFDQPDIFEVANGAKVSDEVKVDWEKLYPFSDSQVAEKSANNKPDSLRMKARGIKARIQKIKSEEIEKWTSERLAFGHDIIELGRAYDNKVGWKIINPALATYKMTDGYYTYANLRIDMTSRIAAVAELRDFAAQYDAKLLFVQAPCKTNKYGDTELNGTLDFANQNADELLAGLAARGVRTLDLREKLGAGLSDHEYHKLFFRTDHHWEPGTALRGAAVLAGELSAMGITVDNSHFAPENYTIEVQKAMFLGSQGKRVTLANTTPDDFPIYDGAFPVNVHLSIPSHGIDSVGDFAIFYDRRCLPDKPDVYNVNQYAAYGYGDVPLITVDNLNLADHQEEKVLIIKDSFGDALVPFLAMGIKHILEIDSRMFTGSIRNFIERERPSVIVIMYTPDYAGEIDQNAKTGKFNLR